MARVSNVFLGILLAYAGCTIQRPYVAGRDCSDFIDFFHRAPNRQVAEFSQFSLEQKYTVYLCGNQFIHPPLLHLTTPLALHGPDVVDFLRERLAEHPDDLTVRDIVRVFREMQRKRIYDVAHDTRLIQLLHDRVAGMKSDPWRRITEGMLYAIVQ